MTTQTAWPENAIARYLTVGGATIDLTHDTLQADDTEPNVSIVHCGGCLAYSSSEWRLHADQWGDGSNWADEAVRRWAQSHAETCRAIPKPA
ncbi:hypothetical protein AB0387_26060 [Streptomyces sp. NPDC089173]|uniref:hypothetical protein n=1 Tax=Streptomyces sp. NPDC089173 TaxID=3154965 RepID=UPI00344E7067